MWKTTNLKLSMPLPLEVYGEACRVRDSDPDFLSRVALYGMTRLAIYEHLQAQDADTRGIKPRVPQVSPLESPQGFETFEFEARLPVEVAERAEAVSKSNRWFLPTVITYGLNRRSIYRSLREQGFDELGLKRDGGNSE